MKLPDFLCMYILLTMTSIRIQARRFEPVLDSAENPLQGMEPTPEFEAVATYVSHPSNNDTYVGEPQFKAGDKVYAPSVGSKIYTLKDVGDGWCYPIRIDCSYDEDHEFTKEGLITAEGLPILFLATELNHALLSQLYPNIEFEQPAKELKGSDLAMAMAGVVIGASMGMQAITATMTRTAMSVLCVTMMLIAVLV